MKATTNDKTKASANRTGASAEEQKKPTQDLASKEFEKASSTQPDKKPTEKRLGDDTEIDDETTI